MTKYQVADLNNGPFGDTFDTLEAAEREMAACIEEGVRVDKKNCGPEFSEEEIRQNVEAFFSVVEVEE